MGWKEWQKKARNIILSHLHLFIMLLKILTQELDARTPVLSLLCLYTEMKSPSFLHSFSTSYAFKDRFPSWATALQQELISSLSNTTPKSFPELLLSRQGVQSLLKTPYQQARVLCSSLFPNNFVASISSVFTLTARLLMQMSLPLKRSEGSYGKCSPPVIISIWDWWSRFLAIQHRFTGRCRVIYKCPVMWGYIKHLYKPVLYLYNY